MLLFVKGTDSCMCMESLSIKSLTDDFVLTPFLIMSDLLVNDAELVIERASVKVPFVSKSTPTLTGSPVKRNMVYEYKYLERQTWCKYSVFLVFQSTNYQLFIRILPLDIWPSLSYVLVEYPVSDFALFAVNNNCHSSGKTFWSSVLLAPVKVNQT